MSYYQDMTTLPDDILAMILKGLPRDNRLNALVTCKKWLDVGLNKAFPPWEYFNIYEGTSAEIDYCGLMGAFNVNESRVNLEYFYYWYHRAGSRFDLSKDGDWFLNMACEIDNPEHKQELIHFLLQERGQHPFDISSAVETICCNEDVSAGYIIFVKYAEIEISKKVLKKWCMTKLLTDGMKDIILMI